MKPNDLIKKSRNSASVAYHKFILLHRKYSDDLFCFYEGKDAHYYFPRVNSYYNGNHHPIVCGNKKSVIRTYELINRRYSDFKTLFFIDSDFDDKIHTDQVYNTPCYSVENFYCTDVVLKRILKNEFMLKETDNEFIEAVNLFNINKKNHHRATSYFNVWYSAAKCKAKSEGTISNISLNDKFPKDFAVVKIGDIKWNYDLNSIKLKFPDAIEITAEELNNHMREFYSIPPDKKHRGKYELEFFSIFLRFLINDSNTDKNVIKVKTSFNFIKPQLMSQISQYAETPSCLVDYIKSCA